VEVGEPLNRKGWGRVKGPGERGQYCLGLPIPEGPKWPT
jgi:hypothetical protein